MQELKVAAQPAEAAMKAVLNGIDRLARSNVEVYGAIYLKTDGKRLLTAFKIESDPPTKKWFWFEYELGEDGQLNVKH